MTNKMTTNNVDTEERKEVVIEYNIESDRFIDQNGRTYWSLIDALTENGIEYFLEAEELEDVLFKYRKKLLVTQVDNTNYRATLENLSI